MLGIGIATRESGFPEPLSRPTFQAAAGGNVFPTRNDTEIEYMGQLVLDFANSKSNHSTMLSTFKGLARLLNFSDEFLLRASDILSPSKREILSNLSKIQKKLLYLLLFKNKIIKEIQGQFEILGIEILDVKSPEETLIVRKFILPIGEDGRADGYIEYSKQFELKLKDIESDDWDIMESWVKNSLQRLFEVERLGLNLKTEVSKSDHQKVIDLLTIYPGGGPQKLDNVLSYKSDQMIWRI